MRNSLDVCRVREGRSGLLQFKCKPGRPESACLCFLNVLSCETTKPLPMVMEITKCSHLYNVKGSLIVHGERCFGVGVLTARWQVWQHSSKVLL